jgi:hypothetical protein
LGGDTLRVKSHSKNILIFRIPKSLARKTRGENADAYRAVIASEAKQSTLSFCCAMDCFASLAMTAVKVSLYSWSPPVPKNPWHCGISHRCENTLWCARPCPRQDQIID